MKNRLPGYAAGIAAIWLAVSLALNALALTEYTYASIKAGLGNCILPACVFILCCAAAFIFKPQKQNTRSKPFKVKTDKSFPLGLRIGLITGAAVLTVLGILNGGMRDVFVKAVNICTECLGLG